MLKKNYPDFRLIRLGVRTQPPLQEREDELAVAREQREQRSCVICDVVRPVLPGVCWELVIEGGAGDGRPEQILPVGHIAVQHRDADANVLRQPGHGQAVKPQFKGGIENLVERQAARSAHSAFGG